MDGPGGEKLVISECVMDGPDVGKGASHQPLTLALTSTCLSTAE
jgi:hypothetical protein